MKQAKMLTEHGVLVLRIAERLCAMLAIQEKKLEADLAALESERAKPTIEFMIETGQVYPPYRWVVALSPRSRAEAEDYAAKRGCKAVFK